MGIMARPAEIVRSLPLTACFSVCELGSQLYQTPEGKRPAIGWYQSIGAGEYASIDADGYGTARADLNYPIDTSRFSQFDLVTDFGTGEHIFNQAQVFATLHDLCKPGGFIVIDRPKTGWEGHCFYNIQETLIRDIAAANAYALVHLETHGVAGHGELLLAVMRKTAAGPFCYPNQGKYAGRLAAADAGAGGQKPVKRGDVLIALVRKNGWKRGAEIGVHDGTAVFFRLLDACADLSMIAVDQWSAMDKDYGDLVEVGEAFRARAISYGDRALIIHGSSADEETLSWVDDASLDFVFIDADHSYEAVKADIAAWTPKVRQGGCVLGHDWNPERFPGVIQAVTEAFGGRIQVSADHLWGVPV